MPAAISLEKKKRLARLVNDGMSIRQASKQLGVSYSWARMSIQGYRTSYQEGVSKAAQGLSLEDLEIMERPLRYDELSDRAKRGLEDFDYFRTTYLGRVTLPWHVEAANKVVAALDSPVKEFVVVNCPPGVGKTTLSHDIAAWVTCRDRRIRGVNGSKISPNARRQTLRLRRTLERLTVSRAKPKDLASGLAVDATAVLALDYGLFKPLAATDVWRAEEFVVLQDDDTPLDEKESTWTTVGQDTTFLGNRHDLILWDDVVDSSSVRTIEAIESQREWWDGEAESRLEPNGALFLIGQRISPVDLYRYNLDKKVPVDEDEEDSYTEEEIEAVEETQPAMYSHIKYVAHDETKCVNAHKRSDPAYPDGCLLDPKRVPWREVARLRSTKPKTFAIQYQQEDANPEDVLVKLVMVNGGTDPTTGIAHPGCWDTDRSVAQLPDNLIGPLISFATVDPSPTKWWAIQWWIYTPNAANRLWLMDTMKHKMGGNELLDYNPDSNQFTGVMEDWQQRSAILGFKINHWIVEVNAAQRFLLQYNHVTRWQQARNVALVPHETTVRKLDPTLGIDMVRDWWASGRIRLPARGVTDRATSNHLVYEVTRYPNAGLDDQVMAHWFGIHRLPMLQPASDTPTYQRRPAFMSEIRDFRMVSR